MNPEHAEFFVYAGTSVPCESAAALSAEVEELRTRNGYKRGDVLKFNTVERPATITPEQHRTAKRELMEAAPKHGVKLFASFLLHSVVKDGDVDEARRKEISRVCFHFNAYMHRMNDHGLVLVDTFTDPTLNSVLREKFSTACQTASRFSRIVLWCSAVLYMIGCFSAYILGPLLVRFD